MSGPLTRVHLYSERFAALVEVGNAVVERAPAIDHDRLAAHAVEQSRAQRKCGAANLVGAHEPVLRDDLPEEIVELPAESVVERLGPDRPRSKRVDPHALAAQPVPYVL